jgi:hypothetical protein
VTEPKLRFWVMSASIEFINVRSCGNSPTLMHLVHDLLGSSVSPDDYAISQPAIRASAKAQHRR